MFKLEKASANQHVLLHRSPPSSHPRLSWSQSNHLTNLCGLKELVFSSLCKTECCLCSHLPQLLHAHWRKSDFSVSVFCLPLSKFPSVSVSSRRPYLCWCIWKANTSVSKQDVLLGNLAAVRDELGWDILGEQRARTTECSSIVHRCVEEHIWSRCQGPEQQVSTFSLRDFT